MGDLTLAMKNLHQEGLLCQGALDLLLKSSSPTELAQGIIYLKDFLADDDIDKNTFIHSDNILALHRAGSCAYPLAQMLVLLSERQINDSLRRSELVGLCRTNHISYSLIEGQKLSHKNATAEKFLQNMCGVIALAQHFTDDEIDFILTLMLKQPEKSCDLYHALKALSNRDEKVSLIDVIYFLEQGGRYPRSSQSMVYHNPLQYRDFTLKQAIIPLCFSPKCSTYQEHQSTPVELPQSTDTIDTMKKYRY